MIPHLHKHLITFSLSRMAEHCSRAPISLCGFHVNESALRSITVLICVNIIIECHHSLYLKL